MKKNLAAFTATIAVVLLAMAVGEAPAGAGAGAGYGAHVSGHARADDGFSGAMNPGAHRGFAGFGDPHH